MNFVSQPIRCLLYVVGLSISATTHAAVTTYDDRGTWQATVGAVTTIDFSTKDDGTPITNPADEINFALPGLALRGVTFSAPQKGVTSYYNTFLYAQPNSPLRSTFSSGTSALGFDLGTFADGGGNATISLSSGESFTVQLPPIAGVSKFIGITSSQPIQWMTVTGDINFPVIDDFSYVAQRTVTAVIEVKPGSQKAPINPRSEGVVPVALLSSPTFSASSVQWQSLRFGATGNEAELSGYSNSDVNGDGRLDVVMHFRTSETGINCETTNATLTGKLATGTDFTAMDVISVVGCPKKPKSK